MPNTDDMRWFKQQFRTQIDKVTQGTPFTLDMLTAIACQETGDIWPRLRRRGISVDRILELCVGDSLDFPNRKAFPGTKADLLARPNGDRMFAIARQALEDMAEFVPGYKSVVKNPNKFCHGYGIFQYDIQFFPTEPDYFLQRRYRDFDACAAKCVGELRAAAGRIGLGNNTSLTDMEMAQVAIAYNTGTFKPSKGLKQGYTDASGRFYGENFFDFLRQAKTVPADGEAPALEPPEAGSAAVSPPTPVEATGKLFEVDVKQTPLLLRSTPKKDATGTNVIARLPDGQIVQAVDNQIVNGFREVETSLNGAHFRGFASADFLKPAKDADSVPVVTPEPQPPTSGIVAVTMPRRPGTVTRRVGPATAHSLNEDGQPGRAGTTPEELRAELAAIVDWLAVDKASHRRYQPLGKTTFCNIYAHDYCHLAGVYLPRVWWTQGAIELLAQGQNVDPKLGTTIDEQRANDLFRWLRDFGPRFGWRQTGSPTKLQLEVNQGAMGIIIARRTMDGLSGHIVAVVPENSEFHAGRDADGEVTAPLQSQAGTTNFRYGTGKAGWWKDARFAESAFWLHA